MITIKSLLISCALAAALLFAPVMARADEPVIGSIVEIEGTATLVKSDGAREKLQINSPIHKDETIETGAASRALVLFIDETQMILSEKTKFRVDEYMFDEDDNTENSAVYNVLEGTFYYVSGLIAKKPDPDVTVKTQFGSIGIRGTQFWGGPIDGSNGLLVAEGTVWLKNAGGETRLDAGQGTSVVDAKAKPTAPVNWKDEKIARAKKTVFLIRQKLVDERIVQERLRHGPLRKAFKDAMRPVIRNRIERRLENRKNDRNPIPREWLKRHVE